jgi:hypothetical protein
MQLSLAGLKIVSFGNTMAHRFDVPSRSSKQLSPSIVVS